GYFNGYRKTACPRGCGCTSPWLVAMIASVIAERDAGLRLEIAAGRKCVDVFRFVTMPSDKSLFRRGGEKEHSAAQFHFVVIERRVEFTCFCLGRQLFRANYQSRQIARSRIHKKSAAIPGDLPLLAAGSEAEVALFFRNLE